MDVRIRVDGDDRLRETESLQIWLAETTQLQGRVTAVEVPPPAGALGPVLDAVLVALAPGGVATALATALISWIRHRSGRVRVEIDLPDGVRVRLESERVRTRSDAGLRAELETVLTALGRATETQPSVVTGNGQPEAVEGSRPGTDG